jgi:hypothetical protein
MSSDLANVREIRLALVHAGVLPENTCDDAVDGFVQSTMSGTGASLADVTADDVFERMEQLGTGKLIKRQTRPVLSSERLKSALSGSNSRGPTRNYDLFLEVAIPALAQAMGGPKAESMKAQQMAERLGAKGIMRADLEIRKVPVSSDGEILWTWIKANAAFGSAAHGMQIPLDASLVQNAYTGAGAYPAMLGGVLDVFIRDAAAAPEITYTKWSHRITDAEDFRAKGVASICGIRPFSLNMSGKPFSQTDHGEEAGLISNDNYDSGFTWTPDMQANDIGSLAMGFKALRVGHDLTLENLHTAKLIAASTSSLAANELGFDGEPIFSDGDLSAITPSARGNWIAKGAGSPSMSQFREMRRRGRVQVLNKIRGDGGYTAMHAGALSKILIGSEWEEAAYSSCPAGKDRNEYLPEPIFVPGLDDHPEPKKWLGIFGAAPAFIHVFQVGYGRQGKFTVWLDPLTGCLHVKCEGRFGVAVLHPQQMVLNEGE